MNRFPSIIYVGAGVILFAAGRLIVDDPSVHHFFENPIIHWGFLALLTIGGLAFGIITNQRRQKTESAHR
jgi:predicted tellurium resistance membrane protein TerC